MLGKNNWRVLTLVTGLLLAQAIDSPGRGRGRVRFPGSFRPQPYREDELSLTDDIQRIPHPYSEELSQSAPEARARYPPARYTREYFPPKLYSSAASDYAEYSEYSEFPPRGGRTPYWKTRSPRVVFPYGDPTSSYDNIKFQNYENVKFQEDSSYDNPSNGYRGPNYGNENVVFRDQNFGVNDLANVQDLRDYNLQDLQEETPGVRERGMFSLFSLIKYNIVHISVVCVGVMFVLVNVTVTR